MMIIPEDIAGSFTGPVPMLPPDKRPEGKFAWTATVGAKGQIVIPKQAREIFGINPGDVLLLLGDTERGIAIPPKAQLDRMHMMMFGGPEE